LIFATKGFFVKSTLPLALCIAALGLGGCSILEGSKVDYKSASRPTKLEVPPDLTQLSKETRYAVVNGAVSAAGSKPSNAGGASAAIAPLALGDIRIERNGNQRWLVVKRPPEALWGSLKDFWQENGFPLASETSDVGIMETEWVDNKARIPQDMIRSALTRVFENLYSSPERRKFRTRLERNASGETEIFISYRSMVEVYTAERSNTTAWQPGPTDPETEAEYLGLLMRKLGLTTVQAASGAGTVPESSKTATMLVNAGGADAYLQLGDTFERAWRRVGLTLDRSGFTVEDRDRSKGLYFVRYAYKAPDADAGILNKIMNFRLGGEDADASALKYQIEVKSAGAQSTVKVLDAKGQADSTAAGRAILKVLANDLK
jgi:outer membrane protein assembly factor BamC